MKKIGKWTPVSSGRFPENNTVVQVTYLDPLDLHTLRCNAFAFYKEGIWYQSTGNRAMKGEVIAWRINEDVCHPEIPINGWIPAIQLPEEMKDVQVTLKSNLPPYHVMNAAFAYVYHGEWCWADNGSKVCVKVLAWKVNDDVYDPEADLEEKYQNALDMDELDFYMDLLDKGFTVERVRKYMGGDAADHMQAFCLNHGLLDKHSTAELFEQICKKLQKNTGENRHGIYNEGDEIICQKKEQADAIADLFEDMGVDVMHTSQEEDGWHVYFD